MRRIATIILSILALISLDYISKKYAESIFIMSPYDYFPIFGEYLWFQLSYNSGIAFSLPITGFPLQILTLVIVFILIWYYWTTEYPKKSTILDIGYSLIIAGALSHAYERVWIGHVIDFISIKYFAILNFADIFISIGAFLIFFVYYVRKQ